MYSEGLPIPLSPNDVVSNAINVVVSRHVMEQVGYFPQEHTTASAVESANQLLEGRCDYLASQLIQYLSTDFPSLFNKYYLLESAYEEKGHFKLNNEWGSHTVFLLQDNEGIFHAGNPTDHQVFQYKDVPPHICNPNLHQTILSISERYGGDWPDADFLANILTQPEVLPRTENNDFLIPVIYRKNGAEPQRFTLRDFLVERKL